MTIEDRTRQQYARVFKDWRIEGQMVGRGSQGKTAVFKIIKENSEFTETGALKIINIYESVLTDSNDRLDEIEKEVSKVKKNAENELAAMNRMKGHGNIVSYHEFDFEEYKTETVRGVDLLIRMDFYENIGSKIKEGVIFSEAEIIQMGKDISRALADCHSKGILHRDIKPDNIFMNEYGYLLGDFGIAKYSEGSDLVASTMSGSYPYAAPEQMRFVGTGKKGKYDYRVDIYALGLSLYELANDDKIPFATSTYKSVQAIQKRLSGEQLPGLPSVSKELEAVILKACTFKPEDRFQTAADMLKAFEGISSNAFSSEETFVAVGGYQVPAKKEETPSTGKKWLRPVVIVAGVLIAVMAAFVILSGKSKVVETPAEPVQAEQSNYPTNYEKYLGEWRVCGSIHHPDGSLSRHGDIIAFTEMGIDCTNLLGHDESRSDIGDIKYYNKDGDDFYVDLTGDPIGFYCVSSGDEIVIYTPIKNKPSDDPFKWNSRLRLKKKQ